MEKEYGKSCWLQKPLDQVRKDTPTFLPAKKRYTNYLSGLKVCEFTLQRKTDEIRSSTSHVKKNAVHPVAPNAYKEIVGRWGNLLALPFNEEKFNDLIKQSRNFIQNYNEL